MMYINNGQVFEWDDEKAVLNFVKHGVDFETATHVFSDFHSLVIEDEKHSFIERRQQCIGDAGLKILIVTFTLRTENRVRIINARIASYKERKIYEQKTR